MAEVEHGSTTIAVRIASVPVRSCHSPIGGWGWELADVTEVGGGVPGRAPHIPQPPFPSWRPHRSRPSHTPHPSMPEGFPSTRDHAPAGHGSGSTAAGTASPGGAADASASGASGAHGEVVLSVAGLASARAALPASVRVGLVATMGALHEGHLVGGPAGVGLGLGGGGGV